MRAFGAALLVLALVGCSADGARPEPTDSVQPSAAVGTDASASPSASPSAAPSSAAPSPPPPTGPRIVQFRVAANPSCPAGTNLNPIEGKPVTLEWSTAGGVTGTELSVDGPGLYGSYGASGSETIFFPCNGAPNAMQTHTYTLRTVGGGAQQSQTLTVQARINEISQV